MKAVALCGSPRKQGNTAYLLKHLCSALREGDIECELLDVGTKKIRGCTACGLCRERKDGTCAVKNDDFGPLFELLKQADIILAGSPVYFGSATPELMAFLDRAGYVSRGNGNLFSRKIGAAVTVARRAGHNFTFAQLLYWFAINDMVIPGSSYWNIAFGKGEGDVAHDAEALATLDRLAANILWLSRKTGS